MARLGKQKRELLQEVFGHFDEHGEWPTFGYLDRKLVRRLDVGALAKTMPRGLINNGSGFYQRTEKVVMLVRALRFCAGTEEAIGDFMTAVRLCVDRFFDDTDPKPEISDVLLRAHGFSEMRVRRLRLLLNGAALTGSGGLGHEGDWHYDISRRTGRCGRGPQSVPTQNRANA
ncbi:MAG: hypothetical protein EPO26_17140 [Chloroflexota bacterium]|nr:MAG: hypothetical protein EPO26_17140 [Chloroflexota bacterium]